MSELINIQCKTIYPLSAKKFKRKMRKLDKSVKWFLDTVEAGIKEGAIDNFTLDDLKFLAEFEFLQEILKYGTLLYLTEKKDYLDLRPVYKSPEREAKIDRITKLEAEIDG